MKFVSRHKFKRLGYVVMPEHVRLIISEPEHSTPSKVLQVPRPEVSRALRKRRKKSSPRLELAFVCTVGSAPAFWQRRLYDFNVWNSKKLREKLNYIHRNPVRRKLVSHPKDWPWSSWAHYGKGERGLIRIDHLSEGMTGMGNASAKEVKTRTLKTKRVRHPNHLRTLRLAHPPVVLTGCGAKKHGGINPPLQKAK